MVRQAELRTHGGVIEGEDKHMKTRGSLEADIIIANAPDPVFVSDLEEKILQANMSSHWTHRTMVNCTTTLLVAAGLLVACDRQTEPSASADPSARMQFDVATLGTADDPTLPSLSAVLQRDVYDLTDELSVPVIASDPPPSSNSTLLWGYEASFGFARILSYNIAPFAPGPDCVPDAAAGGPTGNGRGVAYDPLDGNLWITRLTGFVGDGLIHKVIPPNATPTPGTCPQVKAIPFGDGPGGLIQDDIGALDLDQGSKHIWAAGYAPISVGGGPFRNYFYLVDRNNGKILQSCYIPANVLNGLGFNDSETYARLPGLPGSGQYLMTDGGEFFAGSSLEVIDTAGCHDGKEATIVATFLTTHGLTGIDFEWPGLLSTDAFFNIYNDGNQPFTSSTVIGPANATFGLEDISLCGFRAKFGGDGNDGCRY
jgi:hypothetical protein